MKYQDEETVNSWTRGALTGEWSLSRKDVARIFGPNDGLGVEGVQRMELMYAGNNSMLPHMTSREAMMYNVSYRKKQEDKMHSLPWDTNMLNAFHNLHFIMYMADKVPDFTQVINDWQRTYQVDVPGRPMWILQLIMKAATDCLRDDLLKITSKNKDLEYDYRVTPFVTDFDTLGFELHIAGDCLFDIIVDFNPTTERNGTLGCTYKVTLLCSDWDEEPVPLTGPKSSRNPLKKNMLAMRDYIKNELAQFAKQLKTAEFNRPENALCKLNAK